MTVRILPQSKRSSIIECVLYGNLSTNHDTQQSEVAEMKESTILEVRQLEDVQKQLLISFYSGCTHTYPPKVKTTNMIVAKQDTINGLLQAHLDAEKAIGAEIHPAAQKRTLTQDGMDDDQCGYLVSPGVFFKVLMVS